MRRLASAFGLIIGIAAVVGGVGCGKSPSAPSGSSRPPQPFATALNVSGNTSLTTIGETSQLKAMVTNSDGSIEDVTSAVTWSSNRAVVATVSSSGLLTATGLGLATISVSFPGRGVLMKTLKVVVTPPGTFIASGRVREPGSGSLTDVRVVEPTSGASTMTRSDGEYSLGGLLSARLSFEKQGYEPATLTATPNGFDDVPLQRVLRIAAGETAKTTLAPHDMQFVVVPDTSCFPCRLIRVVSSAGGVIELRLSWNGRAPLNMWAAGQRFQGTPGGSAEVVAEVPVAAGEFVVYVGMTSEFGDYVPFSLATTAPK